MLTTSLWLWLAGCGCNDRRDVRDVESPTGEGPTSTDPALPPFTPPPAALLRVTAEEWRNSAEDLFGVRYEGQLPVDYLLYNYSRVGGSELTIPPLDLEQYEAASWSIAEAAIPDQASAEALLGCAVDDPACVRAWLHDPARRAWRRPASTDDLDEILALHGEILASYGPVLALQASVAWVLQSPEFLFRVEVGEPDPARPDEPGWRRLTSWEVAGRLASFLTASVPDAELAEAAERGDLLTDAGILAQADRLLATPRARAAMQAFFAETLDLHELDSVTKDTTIYPEFGDALREQMALELKLLFTDVALDRGAPMTELLTTDKTFVGPELGALYGVPVAGSGIVEAVLPAGSQRGGLLGRAALLTIQSHNVTTSPTNRGKFVRTRLLCQDIPPPPPGVVTELEERSDGTLREQLEEHATNPACASCHDVMDPPGFALEHFDPIGRWRDLDNGFPIDATGSIDDEPFDGAQQLGQVVAAHDLYPKCIATQLYRFANARVDRIEDLTLVEDIAADFVAEDQRWNPLVHALVLSVGFRSVAAPLGDVCATEGETRPCATGCGAGAEVCVAGRWTGCTAPAPGVEACNGADDDCDGLVDEVLERTCDGDFGLGTQTCDAGAWGACGGPGPDDEVCNGLDDDLDGEVDEGLEVAVTTLTYDELTDLGHYACDARLDAFSPACHAATSRACAQTGCAVTGVGPVRLGASDLDLSCLDGAEAAVMGTTFTALSGWHPDCHGASRQGGACNAAIHRMCATTGLVTGFGPVENSGDDASVVCTPGATVFEGSYATLSGFDSGCNASTRVGAACNHAMHEWCRSQGFATGHGPLENSGDLALVACLGVL
jgi:hypothetical protein